MEYDFKAKLNHLENCSLPVNKIIVGLPMTLFEGKDLQEVMKLMRTFDNPEGNIMQKIYDDITQERNRLITDNNRYYYNGIDFKQAVELGLTPNDVCKEVQERLLRISRLVLVFEPDYYQSFSTNKKEGERYDSVKINWLDDNGKRIRKITKTYGRAGQSGLEYSIPKLLETHLDNLTDHWFMVRPVRGIIFDWVAVINNEKWVFEFKLTKKDDFIKMAVMLESWKLYKDYYGLDV